MKDYPSIPATVEPKPVGSSLSKEQKSTLDELMSDMTPAQVRDVASYCHDCVNKMTDHINDNVKMEDFHKAMKKETDSSEGEEE